MLPITEQHVIMDKIVKTAGQLGGKVIGHCYDGAGWTECSFWKRTGRTDDNRCMLFGGPDGVRKYASEALHICDVIYGVDYTGVV